MPTDPTRVKAIFLEAAELSDEAARAAYLDRACGADTGLRERVEALFRSHDPDGSFLGTPAAVIPGPDHTATRTFEPDPDHAATRTGGGSSSDDEVPLGFLAPATRPDSLGRIGHYEVLQVLGHGGFGIVFRAFDDVLHRVVAVKVLAPQLAATSPARKRFLREARSSAQVRHENVVQVYEVGESPLPYIAMEFIPGETLQQRLDRTGPVEVAEVLRIGRQVAEGLAAAHATDLIHRDIKPGNILLEGGAGRVKITDFGLARAADDASISQSGIIAGTPMYMAPEQAKGEKLDQRADLFSLGSVLYQMAAGRPPFRANGTVAVLKRVAEDTPRDIREIVPEVPQWLCDIITKLHAKDPDDRYQSAREVADVLADCEAQLKANSKLQDFSRIPRSKSPAKGSGQRKWAAVAAVLLLPVIALAVTEFAGVTHLFREQQATTDPSKPGSDPIQVANVEPPPLAIAPFNAAQARVHQEAWAKHLGVPVEYTNSIGMKFRLIPPGEFTMGSSDQEIKDALTVTPDWAHDDILTEAPQRDVKIPEPFYLGTCEVTVGQFKRFVAATQFKTQAESNGKGGIAWTGSENAQRPEFTWRHPDNTLSDEHPVGQICAADANAFCSWLRTLEERNYVLPDEEQWEFACRAGTVTPWSYGTDLENHKAHGVVGWDLLFAGRQVAQKPANPFGLFDVHGNLPEVCRTKDGGFVARSGCSGTEPLLTRSAIRDVVDRLHSYRLRGFRVAIVGNLKPTGAATRTVQVAKQEPLPPTFTNSIGMEFVKVPKGKSWLGGGKDKPGDQEVEIPADFYLGKYEVTQEEWEKIMGENPSNFSRTGDGKGVVKDIPDADLKRFPIEEVSWDQCQVFVDKLNKLEKETGWVYRLPTEAEWEYACRGGPMTDKTEGAFDFYFAKPTDTLLTEQANFKYDKGPNRTCKVGSYKPNVLGLYDMHGNVWEFCTVTWKTADGAALQIWRGGCWNDDSGSRLCRAASRGIPPSPTDHHFALGLRVARVPVGTPAPEAKTPPAAAPFTDADVKRIVALPAAEQVEAVRKELMRRNPGFDGKMEHTIEDGSVTKLKFFTDHVTDVSPVRALTRLADAELAGTPEGNGRLSDPSPLKGLPITNLSLRHNPKLHDLSPLEGMPLKRLDLVFSPVTDLSPLKGMKLESLMLWGWNGTDLSPLKGMPLKVLNVGANANLRDILPLRDLPLKALYLNGTAVSDLAPLKGTRLTTLGYSGTQVTDLAPIKDIPLEHIECNFQAARDAAILRGITTMKTINKMPAAEFWERYDKGEFKE